MRLSRVVLVAAGVMPLVARAQVPVDTFALTGRSTIAFGLGLTGSREASLDPHTSRARVSGELASLSFSHWVRPEVAVEISTAVIGADATIGFGTPRSNVITPVLFGVSYSPRALALSRAIRPYLSAAAGPYIHAAAGVGGASASAITETAAGARLGAGANAFIANHFLLAVGGYYHAVGKFEHPDTSTEGAAGFGMSLGLGFAWGGR